METISWPRRDRAGRRLDRSSFLSRLLDKLESFDGRPDRSYVDDVAVADDKSLWNEPDVPLFKPSYNAWKRLILSAASEVDFKTNSGWPLVHKAFNSMRNAIEDYWPDSSLLKTGLRVAEVTGDAELAVDLVIRALDKQVHVDEGIAPTSLWSDDASLVDIGQPSNTVVPESFEITTEGKISLNEIGATEESGGLFDSFGEATDSASRQHSKGFVRVPVQAFTSAMRVCVLTGDSESTERLIGGIRDSHNAIPGSMKTELYTLALKGFAKSANSDSAQTLLKEMQDGGLNPT